VFTIMASEYMLVITNVFFSYKDQFLPNFFFIVQLISIIYGLLYKVLFQTRKY